MFAVEKEKNIIHKEKLTYKEIFLKNKIYYFNLYPEFLFFSLPLYLKALNREKNLTLVQHWFIFSFDH